jgi:predicted DNA-binding transcriptional regulator YafY
MAKKREQGQPSRSITVERTARLYRLLRLLEKGPQTRSLLMRRLRLDVRGFYRDLELLRQSGTVISIDRKHYGLETKFEVALSQLPFPDPGLTLSEVIQLAKGRGAAHKKLQALIKRVVQ